MDPLGILISRLDKPAPRWADRLRWRRFRRVDVARQVVDHLVTRGDTVLDIGAAQGHFSARLLDLVGPQGAVHAFEPNPVHHERLRHLASDGSLHLHPVALSDSEGSATLHIPVLGGRVSAGLASLEPRSAAEVRDVTVPVRRLDDELGSELAVAFIKCDVEGHEDAVLRGADGLLRRHRPPVLIELENRHRAADVSVALELFAELGYEGWAVFPDGLRPVSAFDSQRDQLAYITGPGQELMPPEYINDFLFVAPGRDLGPLLSPASALAPASAT